VLASFAMSQLNSTCFTPQTLKLYKNMIEIEQQAGVSPEQIGYVESGNQFLENDAVSLIENNNFKLIIKINNLKSYKNIKQRFEIMHSLLATTSFISFGCSIAQLYFLCYNNVVSF
jgi:hypothetical protein